MKYSGRTAPVLHYNKRNNTSPTVHFEKKKNLFNTAAIATRKTGVKVKISFFSPPPPNLTTAVSSLETNDSMFLKVSK